MAPQIIVLALMLFGLVMAAAMHGDEQEPVNFWTRLASSALTIALLWWGGFFEGMF